MTSAGEAAASAATVGQRASHSRYRGTTRSTWVCWSMTSETRIAYGSWVSRHGRSRPQCSNHARSRSSTYSGPGAARPRLFDFAEPAALHVVDEAANRGFVRDERARLDPRDRLA